MRNPSNTSFARQGLTNCARLLQVVQGFLPKHISLAFAGSLAAVVLVSGPHQMPDWWMQNVRSGSADQVASGARVPSADPSDEALFPANTVATFGMAGLSKAEPFHYQGTPVSRARAAECLAAAAWYEVGNDPVGQRAVIQTVVNRVNHPSFPNSICGVIFQGSELPTGCQFTFTCDGSLNRRHPSAAAWRHALELSEAALDGFVEQRVGTATHYHASYVAPWWSRKLERLSSVGPHIFYRWAGAKGAYRQQKHLGTEQDYSALVLKSGERSKGLEPAGTQSSDRLVNSIDTAIPEAVPATAAMSPGRAIYLVLNENEASGRWALAAMKSCKGHHDCQVFGYGNGEDIRRNQARGTQERDRPIFLFVRDATSAMTVALWDCQRIERPRKSECLPTDKRVLIDLMRERPQSVSGPINRS